MRYWLIPVEYSIPAIDAFVDGPDELESAEDWDAAVKLLRGYIRLRAELVRLMDALGCVASAN